jgi:hypothetical protein
MGSASESILTTESIVVNRMNLRRHLLLPLASLALSWLWTESTATAEVVRNPDLTGIWMPYRARGPQGDNGPIRWPSEPPYTAAGQALWDAYTSEFDPVTDDPAKYCVHPGMPTSMLGTPTFPMEIFHRPQDITMMIEAYYQYRKIYMDGYDHPEPILPTRMGYSIAHWEDDTTLVVETSFLSERDKGRVLMSDEASVTERIHVETDDSGQRLLVNNMTFTDPKLYAEPIQLRSFWQYSPDTPIMEYVCSQSIYDDFVAQKRRQAESH